jgi:flagellar biosynthesis regulator FlaF
VGRLHRQRREMTLAMRKLTRDGQKQERLFAEAITALPWYRRVWTAVRIAVGRLA